MTKQQAIAKAVRLAKKNGEVRYVVYEKDGHAGDWYVADDYDMDTFFLGTEPSVCACPDGELC